MKLEKGTSKRQDPYFVAYEKGWTDRPCPRCGSRTATAHGWLYTDPPPSTGLDERRPVGEVFDHGGTDDCVSLAESELKDTNHISVT